MAAASATPAATGTAAVAELQHQVETTVDAGRAVTAIVPVPVPTPRVAVVALPVVMPEIGGRAAAEMPAVSDLLVLLLHLWGRRTSRTRRARQGRAAERGHGNSQDANGEQFFHKRFLS